MTVEQMKQLTPFEQAVILLLEKIARDIESIRRVGEE